MRRIDLRLVSLLTVALGIFCAAGFYVCVREAPLHVPFDPNEGWNAYFQAAAIRGGSLYPGSDRFMIDNYPPLSFYAVGYLGLAVGDNIVAGRIASLGSFAVAIWLIAASARSMGARRMTAGFGALFFAAVLLVFSDYVGMNDPQLMGQAMQLLALYCVLSAPRSELPVALGALLFAASLFVKHNLVALPLSVLVWLAIYERRSAFLMACVGAVAGLAGLVLFRLAFGSDLIAHLASDRTYALANIESGLRAALPWSLVPAIGTVALVADGWRQREAVFCALYAVLAFAVGVVAIGGAGVDVNALFDAVIAFSLAGALLVEQLLRKRLPFSALAASLYLAPIVFGLWQKSDPSWLTAQFWTDPMRDEADTAQGDVAFLRERVGGAACETLPLCYWAGKSAEIDVFNLGQAFAAGARSDKDLIRQIDQKRFATLEFESLAPFQLGPGVLGALRRSYKLSRSSDDGMFFTPSR
jgi:hypothetical protein